MIAKPSQGSTQASEMPQDQIANREAKLSELASSEYARDHRLWERGPNKRENPEGDSRRGTGIHRSVRATSTDESPIAMPAPIQDDPVDDIPGEAENPQQDFEDVEDAFEDS